MASGRQKLYMQLSEKRDKRELILKTADSNESKYFRILTFYWRWNQRNNVQ